MIYTDEFYENIIKKINSSKLLVNAEDGLYEDEQELKEEKIKYVRAVQALDKAGVDKHAAFIKKTRYDQNKSTLYNPTEIFAPEGISRQTYVEIKMQSSPMHIEYWAPKYKEGANQDTDDPIMAYFTLEQYFEKEIKDFGEAWELAQQKQKEHDFITSEMSGGCFEVCSRSIKIWKSKIEDSKPGVFEDLKEQNAIFALIEHYQKQYVTEMGGMKGDIATLPANLATYEPFVEWLMKQNFTVNGKEPFEVRNEISRELRDTFAWSSVEDLEQTAQKMEVESISNAQVTPLKNERAIADKKLIDILSNYSKEKRVKLQQIYDLNIRLKKIAPLEALTKAVESIEKILVNELKVSKAKPVPMEQEIFWAAKGTKVLNHTSDPIVMKLTVMDQVADRTRFGQQTCGYHATKNALAIIYCLNKNDQPAQWVNDLGYFNNIYSKLKVYSNSKANARDINILQIKSFIKDVQENKFSDPVVDKVSSALVATNKPSLSALSVAGFAIEENKFGYASSGSSNLEDAANLYYIATHSTQALQHTFILGNSSVEGHWVTLTLNQDSSGERMWIGTNSDANHEADLIKVKRGLEGLMKNPEAYAQDAYAVAVGDNIATRAIYINKSNLTVSVENKEVLLKSENENLVNIQNAMAFMKRCGWLNSDKRKEHEKEIEDIRYLVSFYANQNIPSKKEWIKIKENLVTLTSSKPQPIQLTIRSEGKKPKSGEDSALSRSGSVGQVSTLSVLINMLKMIDLQRRYEAALTKKPLVSQFLKFQHGDRPSQILELQTEITRAALAMELLQEQVDIISVDENNERLHHIFYNLEKTILKIDGELKKSGVSTIEKVLVHFTDEVALMRKAMNIEPLQRKL